MVCPAHTQQTIPMKRKADAKLVDMDSTHKIKFTRCEEGSSGGGSAQTEGQWLCSSWSKVLETSCAEHYTLQGKKWGS